MQNLGGVTIKLSWNFSENPPIHAIIYSDIFLTFSPMSIKKIIIKIILILI